jgi:hypothetical protein
MIFEHDPVIGDDGEDDFAEFHDLLYGSVPAPTEAESLAMFGETLNWADADDQGIDGAVDVDGAAGFAGSDAFDTGDATDFGGHPDSHMDGHDGHTDSHLNGDGGGARDVYDHGPHAFGGHDDTWGDLGGAV